MRLATNPSSHPPPEKLRGRLAPLSRPRTFLGTDPPQDLPLLRGPPKRIPVSIGNVARPGGLCKSAQGCVSLRGGRRRRGRAALPDADRLDAVLAHGLDPDRVAVV